jgi:hypothetical protein
VTVPLKEVEKILNYARYSMYQANGNLKEWGNALE